MEVRHRRAKISLKEILAKSTQRRSISGRGIA
jgi:hypothetical protein